MTTDQRASGALTIRDIDVHDDAELRDYHRVHQAAFSHGRPHYQPMTFEELAPLLRRDDPEGLRVVFGAWDGGELVGAAVIHGSRVDNLDHAWLFPFVHPTHRRRGIGRALLDEGLRRLAADGRTIVSSEVEAEGAVAPDDPRQGDLAFARAMGFTLDQREVRRVLELPVTPDRLAALDERAARAPGAASYVVEVVDGLPSLEDMAQIVVLDNLVEVDAPSGSRDVEEGGTTAEGAMERYRHHIAAGQRVITVVAREATGEIVGHSRLASPARPDARISQGATYVRRDHRGHGLGAAMKAAGIRWWMEHCPEKPRISTCNAEDNAHMVAINELAGFEPVETLFELIRRG